MMENSDAIQFLLSVKAKIEQGWTQYSWAINDKGIAVDARSSDACAWCLAGAMLATEYPNMEVEHIAERTVEHILLGMGHSPSLIGFNDEPGRTKDEVLGVVQQAITHLEM